MNIYKVSFSPKSSPRNLTTIGTYAAESADDAIHIGLNEIRKKVTSFPQGTLIATNAGPDRRIVKERSMAMKKDVVHRNPKRPPKKWFHDCTSAVERSGAKVSPAKICGAEWYRKMSKAAKHKVMRVERNPVDTPRKLWNTRLTEGRRQELLERIQLVDGPIEFANKNYLTLPFAKWVWSNRDNLKIKKNPQKPVRWYLGLTRDFREWDVFGTNLDPRTHKLYANYVWFYGPFNSKQEALLFKRTENLKR